MEKGCFIVKDRHENVERYPLFEKEIGEVVLKSGNLVSTGALASLGFWDIDVMILTGRGRPVAMLKSLDDDSHVKTRICQYEALHNGKGVYIAKQIVLAKIYGQNVVLDKYGLELHDVISFKERVEKIDESDFKSLRRRLNGLEGKCTQRYFEQVFQLIPEKLRPEGRSKFKAYDGLNNLFNLAYEVLKWRVYRAVLKAKLEPYLGFLHSVQYGKPSLVCDLQELYRYLIDDFVIQYCQNLDKKDFTMKVEEVARKKKGKREYLNDRETRKMMNELENYFESTIEIPRMKVGKKEKIETLINEEALLLAKFLRTERENWIPRLAINI
jgi:CRISPR-associated protein Cas1